jgi:hypothetical protein
MNKKPIQRKFKNPTATKNLKVRRASVTSRRARATVDLGNGFFRFEFIQVVPSFTNFTFTFIATGSQKAIGGGWWDNFGVPVPTLNYPQGNNWAITFGNGTNRSMTVRFHYIVKT